MDYSKFYTPPKIATLLVDQLKITSPSTIIDICCGSCNLLYAAKKRWKTAKLIGVDITEHYSQNVHCIKMDGRKYAIEHNQQYQLVLANPPFDFVAQKGEFPDLFQGVPFVYTTSRLEIEMLFANLCLLNEGGILLIIMPSTFVNAVSNKKIRKYLGQEYHIQKIIKLPEDTFGAAKISSYALIIKKDTFKQRYTRFYSVTSDQEEYIISEPTIITQNQIRQGNWDNEILNTNEKEQLTMKRGTISSHSFCSSGAPILHTAKINKQWKPSIRYIVDAKQQSVYAEAGDIIISRIGKSAGQWCQYDGDRIMISDCLYCLKDPDGRVAEKLRGKQYSLPLKGVATRYITMEDFNSWYRSLE
ncbi:MAG: N-6 DNA methylase [Herbinix sp.]|nr:N-6 DNA methylase [Herbinix sp.]